MKSFTLLIFILGLLAAGRFGWADDNDDPNATQASSAAILRATSKDCSCNVNDNSMATETPKNYSQRAQDIIPKKSGDISPSDSVQ